MEHLKTDLQRYGETPDEIAETIIDCGEVNDFTRVMLDLATELVEREKYVGDLETEAAGLSLDLELSEARLERIEAAGTFDAEIQTKLDAAKKENGILKDRVDRFAKQNSFNFNCRNCECCEIQSKYNCPDDANGETCFVAREGGGSVSMVDGNKLKPGTVCGGGDWCEEVMDCGCLPSDLCDCERPEQETP